jgi:hypothetical protein
MFQKKVIEKTKIHVLYSIIGFRKSRRLGDDVAKCCTAGQAIDANMAHAHCKLDA